MNKEYEIRQSRTTTWFKFYSENYIWGSTRSELNPDERAVWVDFLCLATMKFGQVEVYSRDQLAQQLVISKDLLDGSIEKFIKYGKIKRKPYKKEKKEVFIIINWERYQADYLTKRQKKSSTYEEKERIEESEISDAENQPILEERRGENITLKENALERIKNVISGNAKSLDTEAFEDSSPLSSSSDAVAADEKSIKEAFLSKLKSIKYYPFDESLDSMLFDDIETECPGIDILKHLDGQIDWMEIEPEFIEKASNPRKEIKDLLKLEYEKDKGVKIE